MSESNFYCLKHVPFEGPGLIASCLNEKGYTLNTVNLYEDQPLPTVESVDYLIVMGGPMNISDEEKYRWLTEERNLIGNMITAGKPLLGICLGAQMIAHSLGCPVYPARDHEIGWHPVTVTEEGKEHPATRDWGENPVVFHWHSSTFDLPNGAVHLASTEICPNQAFICNQNIIGLQFHLEINRSHVQEMIDHWGRTRESGPWVQQPETMLAKSDAAVQTRKMLYSLLDYWLDAE